MEHPENDSAFLGLNVNKGIEQPPSVNPYLKRIKRQRYTSGEYVEGILKGDISMLGQAVTLANGAGGNRKMPAILRQLYPAGNNRSAGRRKKHFH